MTGFTQWGREKFKLKKQCFLLQLAKVKSLGHCKIFKESGIFWVKSKNSLLAYNVEHDQWKKCTWTNHHEKKSTLVCSRDTTTPSQRPLMNQTKFGLNFTRTKRAKNQLERERDENRYGWSDSGDTIFPHLFQIFFPCLFSGQITGSFNCSHFRAKEQ